MINDLDIVQWDYLLSPEFEMINSAGKPLTGGYIEVYIHGTRNKYYCASDFNGTLHPFQIPLDSIGSNVILASPENAYDVYVYNKFGSLIMSRYNVHCQGGNGGSSTYVGDKLFYGQYRASDVTTIANLRRNKGNINITSNGYLKLKNGMSYHITVRGAFQVDNVANTETTLNYIEYTSVNPIKIDIDETKEGPQYFELSYDIYRLPEDMDYQVAFAQSNGMVTELLVEVHSLSNLATSSAGGDQEYEPGWGINITNNVISVDPSILDDYVTEEELLEIVTGITGIIPEDVATHTEVYEATVTAIELVTGMIPDVSDYTTHTEVYESIVTAIDFVTGVMPAGQIQSDWDQTDNTQPDYIKNKPDLDIYATHSEVNNVSGQIIETVNNVSGDIIETVNNVSAVLHGEIANIPEQVQSDWDQTDDTQVDYIKNKPDLSIYATHDEVTDAVTSIDLSEYATHTEVYEATVTAIELVTGAAPETINLVAGQNVGIFEDNNNLIIAASGTDLSDYTTNNDVYESIVTAIDFVTGAMPAGQVQSDWTETNTSDPAYIKNKPNEYGLVPGDNIGIIIDNVNREIVISASATDLSDCATHTEVYNSSVTAVQLATGLIPDVSDFTTHDEVHESIVTALEYVTGIIPDAQVQSNWTETNTSDPSYIQNKPNEYTVVAGQNIGISIDGDDFIISASGTDLSDYTTFEDVISIVSGVTGLTEYGQFYATNISGAATMFRTKGTIDVTNDGKIKLKKGSSYHVTVRGRYNQTTAANTYGDISYIEYITGQSIHVNVDKTITESQYFELSYDLYKLNNDSNYYVFFSMSGGTVNDLFIEIHSLDGIGGTGTGPVTGGTEYDAGWGIQILNNVISVNPAIIPDISPLATKAELQDGLELVTGLIPTDYTTHNEVYEATVTAINVATGLIPDISNLATKDELQDNIELVTGLIPDISPLATKEELQDGLELVTGLIPPAQIQSDWNQSDNTQVDYIKNKPDLTVYATNTALESVSANIVNEIPDVSEFATHSEVNNVSGAIMNEMPDITPLATKEELQDGLELVTGLIPDAQVQSDWTQSDNTQVDYIKNKPAEYTVVAGQNIGITVDGNDFVISASATDLSGYATTEQLQDSVELVTGLIPDTSDMATKTWVNNQGFLTSIPDTYATDTEVYNAVVTGVQVATGMIPNYTAGDNIEINNDTISLSDIINIESRSTAPSGKLTIGNVTHWGQDDYGPGIIIDANMDDSMGNRQYHWYNTSDQGRENRFWGQYESDRETNSVSGESFLFIEEGDVKYQRGDFGVTTEVPIVWSCSGMRYDIDRLQEAVTAIPDVSDMATMTWVNNQGFLTSVPSNYATDAEVSEAIASSVTGFATKLELSAVESTIPTVQLNGDDQVTAINNHEIAGTGGTTYTAGDYISIDNDEISVTGIGNLVAGNNITITESGNDITISAAGGGGGGTTYTAGQYISIDGNDVISVTGLQVAGSYATTSDISDMATKTWVGNQGYLTSVPSNYATDIEVSQAIASSVTDFVTESQVTALIPESEDVDFEELDVTQLAQASAIPTIQLNSNNQVTAINNHEIAGGGGATYTAGNYISINNNNVIAVTGLDPLPDSEEVDFEEVDLANYALASAIPAAPVQSNWNETNSSSLAYIQNKPDLSVYATTSAMNTAIDTSKVKFSRISNTGTTNLSQLTTTGLGTGKLTVNLASIFNTNYSMLEWIYCENDMWWGYDKSVYWFTFSARLNNIVATQWSQVNDAIQLKAPNAVFISGIRAICGDSWNPTTLIIFNDGAWTSTAKVVRRDIRNSSTADNNTFYLWFSGYICVP